MKRVVSIALVLAVLGWTVPARAAIGTIDDVPAATLLLPYFEVDLDNPTRRHHAVLDQQRVGHRRARPRRRVDRPVGPGARLRRLPDRLRRADDQPARHPSTASCPDATAVRPGRTPQRPRHQPAGPLSQDINFAAAASRPAAAVHATRCSAQRSARPPAGGPHRADRRRSSAAVRGPSLRRQHRPRLHHGRHGDAVHPVLPRRPRLLLSGGIARHRPERPLGRLLLRQPGPELRPGRDAGPHRVLHPGQRLHRLRRRRPLPDHVPVRPGRVHLLRPLRRLAGSDQREPLATTFAARFLNGGGFAGGTDLARLARLEGDPGGVHLPGDSGRPARHGSRSTRKGS